MSEHISECFSPAAEAAIRAIVRDECERIRAEFVTQETARRNQEWAAFQAYLDEDERRFKAFLEQQRSNPVPFLGSATLPQSDESPDSSPS